MTEESQAPQDVDDASPHPLVARLREFGPAGWFFVVFLVVAITAVAVSLSGSEEAAPSSTEVAATEATEATSASTTATTAGTGDSQVSREALDTLQACLEEDESLPLRVLGLAGDRVEVGTRNQDRVAELGAALAESTCFESFQAEFPDIIVVVVGPDDRGEAASPTTVAPTTVPESTDGSVVPTAPSTDITLP